MGTAEQETNQLLIHSHIITYGNVAGPAITEYIRDEIETLWNEPNGDVNIDSEHFRVIFKIIALYLEQKE